MVTIDKVKRGIINYADAEILSRIPGGLKKVMIGAGLTLYINNLEQIVMEQKDTALVAGLGIFQTDGAIDIDRIADAIKNYVPSEGMPISIDLLGINMTLHKSDIDNIRYHINNA